MNARQIANAMGNQATESFDRIAGACGNDIQAEVTCYTVLSAMANVFSEIADADEAKQRELTDAARRGRVSIENLLKTS